MSSWLTRRTSYAAPETQPPDEVETGSSNVVHGMEHASWGAFEKLMYVDMVCVCSLVLVVSWNGCQHLGHDPGELLFLAPVVVSHLNLLYARVKHNLK